MSSEMSNSESNPGKTYLETWADSACQVLEQISKSPFTPTEVPPQEVESQFKELTEGGIWVNFAANKQLTGQQAMLVSSGDAIRLAQMLMMETVDSSRPYSAEYGDALGELFRQFAGLAAQALASKFGQEVEFQFAGMDRPNWTAGHQSGFKLASEKAGEFQIYVALSPELSNSIPSPTGETTEPSTQVVPPPEPPLRDRNIDLLLDVDLEVALRFGAREMPLREILELNAGAVVELDRRIQEPVELLLGGKVVARGEVVVMDGNYALRVTEIISPMERVASLPRC